MSKFNLLARNPDTDEIQAKTRPYLIIHLKKI